MLYKKAFWVCLSFGVSLKCVLFWTAERLRPSSASH